MILNCVMRYNLVTFVCYLFAFCFARLKYATLIFISLCENFFLRMYQLILPEVNF